MTPFLLHIAEHIHKHYEDSTETLCVMLPNKRGALYLKKHLASVFHKTIWLPTIISTENLIEELSELKALDNIDLICELYVAYKTVLEDKAETFDAFAKWGNLMLQDFNEADRYLVDTDSIYQNLKEIKEIENWSLSAEKLTSTQQDYIDFMGQMGEIYKVFTKKLLDKKQAYQGLMYRVAVDNHQTATYPNQFSHILICGFNALNKAETIIFSDLVKQKKATVIYDGDEYYVSNPNYEAGLFLRKNIENQWLKSKNNIGTYFKDIPKTIDVVAVPNQMGQAQVVANQLQLWISENKSLSKTAIVLADESLLFPVLNQLPKEIEFVNITMEYPLRYTPIFDLIDNLINLHEVNKGNTSKSFYFADVFKIIYNGLFVQYFNLAKPKSNLQAITQLIIDKNYVWINENLLESLFKEDYKIIQPLFKPWQNSVQGIGAIAQLLDVFNKAEQSSLRITALENEYLHVFTKQFNRLQELVNTHDYLNSLSTLKSLFKQIIGTASVPFIGEPLQGLQIMGVLESRTLDFENVILLGVNEGVLPSGKSTNSFIPNDLKRYHNLPLYGEKDAIYAYHFYRLLQRASNVLLTYNTQHTGIGSSEKSRFITQLQFELNFYNSQHTITERMLSGGTLPPSKKNIIKVSKTNENLQPILYKFLTDSDYTGLSPSALMSYKDCALRFFFRYGAGIKEAEDIEESAEASTQGTILHKVLEELYKPHIGSVLNEGTIKKAMSLIETTVDSVFQLFFSQKESQFGKNYLQRKVLNEYVTKLLKADLLIVNKSIQSKQYLTLLDLEKKLTASVTVNINGEEKQVYIKGSADRLDRIGEVIRIVDYKSSVKTSDKFKFTNFEDLFEDSNYNKMLQLFIYAWLVVKNNLAKPNEIQPCIIPFKKFEEKPKFILTNDKKPIPLVLTEEILMEFEFALIHQIEKIVSTQIPFEQTANEDNCEYCSYASICNVK